MIEVGIMPYKQYFKADRRENAREEMNYLFNFIVVYSTVYGVADGLRKGPKLGVQFRTSAGHQEKTMTVKIALNC